MAWGDQGLEMGWGRCLGSTVECLCTWVENLNKFLESFGAFWTWIRYFWRFEDLKICLQYFWNWIIVFCSKVKLLKMPKSWVSMSFLVFWTKTFFLSFISQKTVLSPGYSCTSTILSLYPSDFHLMKLYCIFNVFHCYFGDFFDTLKH